MDISKLGPMFIVNNIIQKMNLENDIHLLIMMFIIYNYFPQTFFLEKINKYYSWYFPSPTEKKYVSVIFKLQEKCEGNNTSRSDRYLALMDYIKKISSISHSESIDQTRNDASDVSIYEICQKDEFLIDEEKKIYGHIFREVVNKDNGELKKITLLIKSYSLTHSELIEWIEKIKDIWAREWKNYLKKDTIYMFDIDWRKGIGGERAHTSLSKFTSNVNFDNTFFPKKDLLVEELERFKNGKDIYEKTGQPWQYGIMLSGEPGTGKTRIVKCIANYMKRHVVNICLSDNFQIESLISIINGYLPIISLRCDEYIIVIEEAADQTTLLGPRDEEIIPTHEANDIISKRRAYLSRLLPAIDGINERFGGMIIMTTNFIDRLDRALLRPGRSDYHLHMEGGYDRQTLWNMLKFQYPDFEDRYTSNSIIDSMCDTKNGCEIVQYQRTLSKEELMNKFFKV